MLKAEMMSLQSGRVSKAWDDATGADLDPAMVTAARTEEMQHFREMQACTREPRANIQEVGETVSVKWLEDTAEAAAVAKVEAAHPTDAELAYRDPDGLYGPDAPFWATVTHPSAPGGCTTET